MDHWWVRVNWDNGYQFLLVGRLGTRLDGQTGSTEGAAGSA